MLFSRASDSHYLSWLKLPAGSALSSTSLPTGVSAAVLPKRSRPLYRRVLALSEELFTAVHFWQAFIAASVVWPSSYWRADSLVTSAPKREYDRIHLLHPAGLP
ncbi:MAG: hypothetical protein AUF67_05005 [Acidobacteria bacterium 13_1_20CM_58_21]|nr:MAG: hypothetical protein AUF67_05005 [Acidobacteria bacterium 13_1_20CM_58_21]